MTVDRRYQWPIVGLLLVAFVPTYVHSYRGATIDDGRRTAAIDLRLDGSEAQATDRKAEWVQRRFDATDWIEREYGNRRLFVARSLDIKSLYHHPELAVAYGQQQVYEGWRLSDARPDMPIHVLAARGDGRRGVYALLYGRDRFVAQPLWFHVRLAGELLARPREPMTLFFVTEPSRSASASDRLEDWPSVRLLFAAVASFEGQVVTSGHAAPSRRAGESANGG